MEIITVSSSITILRSTNWAIEGSMIITVVLPLNYNPSNIQYYHARTRMNKCKQTFVVVPSSTCKKKTFVVVPSSTCQHWSGSCSSTSSLSVRTSPSWPSPSTQTSRSFKSTASPLLLFCSASVLSGSFSNVSTTDIYTHGHGSSW